MTDGAFRYPSQFLGLEPEFSVPETSAVWVLPIPLEMTTSYMGGTKMGPSALIEASTQVELFDPEIGAEGALRYGVHTLPMLHPPLASAEGAVEAITEAVGALNLEDRLLVTLGGEHTITPGVVHALTLRYPELVLVQIDAHADLRDTFDGTAYSHACAMRRSLNAVSHLYQFGIRSVCVEESVFMRESNKVTTWSAENLHVDRAHRHLADIQEMLRGRPVYLTIDLDGLDPSVIAAVGTPEPGGINWYDCLDLIRAVVSGGSVVALDCVELCPTIGQQASAFAGAKLIYKTINLIMRSRGKI